ncbi:hypothetical protein ANO11243_019080 [Dothideomycetidae sp. 11243]|nr:hypothetical protein ANO11243_019080 [fungal sp. No.11243]
MHHSQRVEKSPGVGHSARTPAPDDPTRHRNGYPTSAVPDEPLVDIIKPSLQTIGPEHEWALSIFDMIIVFADFHASNNEDGQPPDEASTKIVAVEMLQTLPAWKLHWNDDSAGLDEVCRQLQFQLSILSRILLFIVKQLPDSSREHMLLGTIHVALFALAPTEFMPERFSSTPHICSWTRHWLEHSLLNISSPDPDKPNTFILSADQHFISDHHPSRNIWLFDAYLSPTEHATLSALKARIWLSTGNPLLQLCAQSSIERLLTRIPHLPGSAIDILLPSAATWFLHAYSGPSTPEAMLKGWYDICLPPPADPSAAPTGARYAWLPTQEARWWVFFKRRFLDARDREDVGFVAREYAGAALRRMEWLDGSDRVGFYPEVRLRVDGGRKKAPVKL